MHTRGNNYLDLIHCRIVEGLIIFALPMIAGDLLQQFYHIDCWKVYRERCTGCSGVGLFSDDIPYICFSRPFHGCRCFVFR